MHDKKKKEKGTSKDLDTIKNSMNRYLKNINEFSEILGRLKAWFYPDNISKNNN